MAKRYARGKLFRPSLLALDLVTEDGRGRGHVERLHVTGHRDRDDAVAVLQDVASDPLPLVPDDERDLAAEVDRVGSVALLRGGVDPVAGGLEGLDGAREGRHLPPRHPFPGTG